MAVKESIAPAWRDLLVALRRMESRGEIRGGRFVEAFLGEQFALPEALDLLRAIRRSGETATEAPAMLVRQDVNQSTDWKSAPAS